MCKNNWTWSVCLHPSSTPHLSSGPLNLQLVGETPAVAFNWVGDVTKLSSGLCVCTRAHAYVCGEDEGVSVCRRQRVRALLCSGRAKDSLFFGEWIVLLLWKVRVSETWIVFVTSLLFEKKLEVLESESALVENGCKTFFYILFVRWSSFSHDVNTGLFKPVS